MPRDDNTRQRLEILKVKMLATPDQQISLTDLDARSMATSGRGSGVVGYNVQVAVDTKHHLIVMHQVTNVGTDRSQLAHVATLDADPTSQATCGQRLPGRNSPPTYGPDDRSCSPRRTRRSGSRSPDLAASMILFAKRRVAPSSLGVSLSSRQASK
jgi:hypothetical protein